MFQELQVLEVVAEEKHAPGRPQPRLAPHSGCVLMGLDDDGAGKLVPDLLRLDGILRNEQDGVPLAPDIARDQAAFRVEAEQDDMVAQAVQPHQVFDGLPQPVGQGEDEADKRERRENARDGYQDDRQIRRAGSRDRRTLHEEEPCSLIGCVQEYQKRFDRIGCFPERVLERIAGKAEHEGRQHEAARRRFRATRHGKCVHLLPVRKATRLRIPQRFMCRPRNAWTAQIVVSGIRRLKF